VLRRGLAEEWKGSGKHEDVYPKNCYMNISKNNTSLKMATYSRNM